MQGEDDGPYVVPLLFAYVDGRLSFHSAPTGHRIDALERNPKASFCVIAADDGVPSTFTTHFRSAIAFGRLRVLTEEAEKRHALECLARKSSPQDLEEAGSGIRRVEANHLEPFGGWVVSRGDTIFPCPVRVGRAGQKAWDARPIGFQAEVCLWDEEEGRSRSKKRHPWLRFDQAHWN